MKRRSIRLLLLFTLKPGGPCRNGRSANPSHQHHITYTTIFRVSMIGVPVSERVRVALGIALNFRKLARESVVRVAIKMYIEW